MMRRDSPLACLLLSALLALCIAGLEVAAKKDAFLHCLVKVESDTVFSLYTAVQGQYDERRVERRALLAYPAWQAVKFKIPSPPSSFASTLRLDFESRNKSLLLGGCHLTDEYGLDYRERLPVQPLHEAVVAQKADSGSLLITATGSDPQLALSVNWLDFFRQRIQIGFFIACIQLVYPLCFFFLSIINRILPLRPRAARSGLHGFLLATSLMVWGLAGLAWWLAGSRHTVLQVPDNNAVVPVPAVLPAEAVVLERTDGLEIAGRLYAPRDQGPFRGNILLLHGNYPQGQMFALYPLLARSLADRGFRVLTIDFAGFGKSADPFASSLSVRTDLESETEQALAYLKSLPGGAGKLSIIAHSMGANPALRVGLRDPDLVSLVLIGPPRRVADRFLNRGDLNFFWNWALGIGRSQYGREQFPSWYSLEQWQAYYLDHDMVHSLPLLRQWGHKPVYFLDGGDEAREDHVFLHDYAAQVSAPSEYVTVQGVDHDFNVKAYHNPPVYEPEALHTAVQVLEQWCSHDPGRLEAFRRLGRNILLWLFPFR